MICEVCSGSGEYPVIDCRGTHRYSIKCPECFGDGKIEIDEEEIKAKADWEWNGRQFARYHAHMEAQRRAPQ